jgi:hypothetical protein
MADCFVRFGPFHLISREVTSAILPVGMRDGAQQKKARRRIAALSNLLVPLDEADRSFPSSRE